ncbi:probable ATP-dependent RNA helicase kurz [Phymastichus coffea]|uniref:probable ATP-dependent RNA helicase kurz n=1 Tax=Phymastichus coffea TaxID=108790 RepID=UPI00273AB914|nr:probable ATP-dependent RNA helicase kurz [Phymastichus coffea]
MGRNKRFNSKARNVPEIKIDNSSVDKISVDITHRDEEFDSCNALVLPSEKRKTKVIKDKAAKAERFLSKKKRKQLEKVIERKKKKKDRAALVEELSKTNVPDEELKKYVSLTAIQTKGLKRHLQEEELETYINSIKFSTNKELNEPVVNALKGAKKRRITILSVVQQQNNSKDPNVLDIDTTSDSESETYENEENEKDIEIHNDNSKTQEQKTKTNNEKPEQKEKLEDITDNFDEKGIDEIVNKQSAQNSIPNVNKEDSKIAKYTVAKIIDKKPAVFVSLNRKSDIQEARLKLPILADEQIVVEAINENPVVIITGETGSGKTTQVPQFLYEAGYAKEKMIGITEPRRVAAISMSKRVAEEMNLTEKEVSYLIRFEGNVNPETKIKFMTDGVLLKEVQNDFLLKKYSVIILDEAHERSVYTDILIGLLTRIVSLRSKREEPLKLIIMSATLRVEDFINNPRLFKVKPPVINVDSRQFPVTIHFNRRTDEDYVKEAFRKTVKIHTQLPDGGILVFLTGQREVNTVVKRLRKAFPFRKKIWTNNSNDKKNQETSTDERNVIDNDYDSEDEFFSKGSKNKHKKIPQTVKLPQVNLDLYNAIPPDDGQDDLIDIDNDKLYDELDDDEDEVIDLDGATNLQPMWVLPLYSLLPSYKQAKVFEPPPDGCRLVVVSTNVAETSLTIPNIKYVVDSGKTKIRMYDKVTGVTTFMVTYTSKAAANQRSGRAGRLGPGHCYRLYSSAVFNDQFPQFSEPEICRKPVDDLLLQMKLMNIDKVVNFPFPTPPGEEQLKMAEKRLRLLGALQQPSVMQKKDLYCAKITDLGKSIAAFPVLPRYGKMLALSQQHNLIAYAICMVAALSVQELLVEAFGIDDNVKTKWTQIRRSWVGTGNSFLLGDPMVLIRAVGAAEYSSTKNKMSKFCEENGLREKAMIEIRKLRCQLTNEILLGVPDLKLTIDPKMPPPTDTEAKLLRQIILSGMTDQVAHKLLPEEVKEYNTKTEGDKIKWKYAYKTLAMEDPVFMHSSCVLRKSAPEWVVYQEVYETNKIYIRGITAIEPEWLPKFVPSLCSLSEPLIDPPPRYDAELGKVLCHKTGTFGPAAWELPTVEVEFPNDFEGIKWFAKFLLEGEIFPKLKKYVPILLSTPSSLNKTWAKLLPRVEIITKLLLSKGIMSKDKLIEAWKEDPQFLLSAYQKWLPESAHAEVMLMWPPLET